MNAIRLALAAALVASSLTSSAFARAPGTFIVHSHGTGRVDLDVFEAKSPACSDEYSATLYSGPINPDQLVFVSADDPCVCIRSTSVEARDWSNPVYVCRPPTLSPIPAPNPKHRGGMSGPPAPVARYDLYPH